MEHIQPYIDQAVAVANPLIQEALAHPTVQKIVSHPYIAEQHPAVLASVAILGLYIVLRIIKSIFRRFRRFPRIYPEEARNAPGYYDVAIVGAGPSGSTCAWYMAKDKKAKVLLLERKQFPRDKYCGDAVCKTAIEILQEMGVYDQLLKENKAHVADSGGMVSPGGLRFIGRSHEQLGAIPAAIAVKRIHLDEAIAAAAKKAGADLRENMDVIDAKFDKKAGMWTVYIDDEKKTTFKARTLVCADGAPSKLATHLGYVNTPPQGSCSRAFVEGGTHNLKADGVVYYNKDLLPGYAALFRHPNDELNYCCYLIPGNPNVKNEDLAYWHEYLIKKDPAVSQALGNKFKMEKMRAGSLRLGGIPVSHDDHLIIVGDAAGMIDPMTGEGIHHAMDGGRIAAKHLLNAVKTGNFSRAFLQQYHDDWMNTFGHDFAWSMNICQILYRFPILIDAATAAVLRKGDKFLARWADIMTGRVPKIHLLRPEFVIVITFELFLLLGKRLIGVKPKTQ